jgi:autotransporter-associated beta strand protein
LSYGQLAPAADVQKADNSDNLNLTTSWTGGAVPAASDVAVWDSAVTANNTTNTLGASASWSGIKILSPAAGIVVITNASGNTLTVGAAGINMAGASQNLSLSNNVGLPDYTVQTWNVPSGRTLSLQGAFTRSGGSALKLNAGGTINIAGGTASSMMGYGLYNGTDIAAWDASKNVSSVSAVIGYITNPLSGVPSTQYVDVTTGNTGTADDMYLNTSIWYPRAIRVNMPQPNRNYWSLNAYKGQFALNSGVNTILITTNVGACNVINTANSAGHAIRWSQTSTGSELVLDQENTAGDFICNGPTSQRSALAGNILTKRGAGRAIFNAVLYYTGPTRILEGELMLNNAISSTSVVTVNNGATLSGTGNVPGSATNLNGGTIWAGNYGSGTLTVGTLTMNAGSGLKFYASTVPTTNTAALLSITNAVSVRGAVNVSIVSGGVAVGQFPLIKAAAAFSGAAFANFNLALVPPHVSAYLSNNTANASIDLVVTSVNLPIAWAVGSANWDINISSNWKDTLGAATTYQEMNGTGDKVLFEDALSGTSPITVTDNVTVSPASTTVSNVTKSYTISGSGSIAGTGRFTKSGSGALTLATANTFTGGLNLNGGTLSFSALNNLGAGAINFGGGTLQYNGNTDDISGRTVTFGVGGAAIDTAGQAVSYASPVGNSGLGGLTKAGAGTLTLNATNRYSGNTLISAGTLALGSATTYIPTSAAIIIGSGAILDVTANNPITLATSVGQVLAGVGSINGGVTVPSGTTITPATNGTVGTLTLNSGDLAIAGGTYACDMSTSLRDLIFVNGNLSISGGTLALNVLGPLANGIYKVIEFTGTLTSGPGSAGSLTVTGIPAGKAVTVSEGANEIDILVATTASDVITWAGVGSDWDLAGTLNWTNPAAASLWAFTNGDYVTFDDLGSAQPYVSLKAAVAPSRVTVTSDSAYYSFDDGTYIGAGKITGAATLIKNGTSFLVVNSVNDNTGPTVINGGTLQVNGHIGTGNITNHGELIFSQNTSRSVAGSISGPGNLTQSGYATLSLLADNGGFSGGVTIGYGSTLQVGSGGASGSLGTSATVANNGTLTFNKTGAFAFAGAIEGGGAVIKSGSGAMTLTASNSYSGATTINDGKLILGSATAHAGNGALIVQIAGTNDLNGYDMTVARLWNSSSSSAAGGRIVNNSGTGTNVLTINYDGTGAADSSMAIADNDGSGGKIKMVKEGTGTQMLRGASTYSGGTVINAGALQARSQNNAFGTGGTIILNGGTLDNYASSLAYPVTTTADSGLYSAANCYFNGPFYGTNTLSVRLAGSTPSGETISWGTSGQLAGFSGKFVCTVDSTTYGRFWRWTHAANTLNGSATAAWDLQGNVAMTCQNSGCTILLGSLEGSTNTVVRGNYTTYVVGSLNASTTYSGDVYGTGSFLKTGAGALTLDSSYTFYGSTVVSNGTLVFANAANPTNSSAIRLLSGTVLDIRGMGIQIVETNEMGEVTNTYVQVTSRLDLAGNTTNQTLAGGGTILGSVVASANSTISPGDGIGTLTVATNVTLGGLLVMELNRTNAPATNDMLVAASLTGGGTLTVTNLGPTLYTGDTFRLFSQPVGNFTAVNLPLTYVQNGITYSYTWANKLAIDGTIQVLSGYSPVDPTPTNITCTYNGSTLTLSWPDNHKGWTLETNSVGVAHTNYWFPYPGSADVTSVVITPGTNQANVFFRMRL